MQPYDTGPKGIALIKEFEGFSAIPYQCPAGIWTIGYGAARWIYASGKPLNGLIKRRAAEAALFMHEPSASEDV